MRSLARRVAPSVVVVVSDGFLPAVELESEGDLVAMQQTSGSGVIISPDGYIITNAHVVQGATRVQVQLPPREPDPSRSIVRPRGRGFAARVIGTDAETDIALLKIEATNLPALDLADSDDVHQGQLVFAIGTPRGLENSLSMGVVSAVGRLLRPDDHVVYLQTDAPINPGNSGGPLLDIEGRVVGINTLIVSESQGNEGLGFAVPSNIVQSVVTQLRAHGEVMRGDIGVWAQSVTPGMTAALELPVEGGVIVADVEPGGPGDIAGARIGDVILRLNGKPMENARQFHVNIYNVEVNSVAQLEILRKGKAMTLRPVVLDRPDAPARLAALVNERQNLVARLGVLAVAKDKQLAAKLPPFRRNYGILVAKIALGPRPQPGLFQPGDLIYEVNGQPISTLHELRSVLDPLPPGEHVVFQIERRGRIRYLETSLD